MAFSNDYTERAFSLSVELLQQYYAACDAENEVVPDIEKAIEEFFQPEMLWVINEDKKTNGYHEFLKSDVKGYPWYQFDKFPVVRAEALIGNPNLHKIGCPANPPALSDIADKIRNYMEDYKTYNHDWDNLYKKYHNHRQPKGIKEFLKATRDYYGEYSFKTNSGSSALHACCKDFNMCEGEPYKSHPEKLPAYLNAIAVYLAANTDWKIESKPDGIYVDEMKLKDVNTLYGFKRDDKRDIFEMYSLETNVILEDPELAALGYGDNFVTSKTVEPFMTEYSNLPQDEVRDYCADYTYEPYGFSEGYVYTQRGLNEEEKIQGKMWKDVDMELYNQCVDTLKKAGYRNRPDLGIE